MRNFQCLCVFIVCLLELAHINEQACLHAVEFGRQAMVPVLQVILLSLIDVIQCAFQIATSLSKVSQLHIRISVARHLSNDTFEQLCSLVDPRGRLMAASDVKPQCHSQRL